MCSTSSSQAFIYIHSCITQTQRTYGSRTSQRFGRTIPSSIRTRPRGGPKQSAVKSRTKHAKDHNLTRAGHRIDGVHLTISVGNYPNRREFTLDRGLAIRFSRYFWNYSLDLPGRPGHRFFLWPHERPATFERFIAWINDGVVTKDLEDRFNIDLFDLASRLDAKLLINDLIEEYRREFLIRCTTADDITRLYAHENMGRLQILNAWLWVHAVGDGYLTLLFGDAGPDRRFTWDLLRYLFEGYSIIIQAEQNVPPVEHGLQLLDLALAMLKVRRHVWPSDRCLQVDICQAFHVHEPGVRCDPGLSRGVTR
jgi:hypothetical protein